MVKKKKNRYIMPKVKMHYGKENGPLKVEAPIKNQEYQEKMEENDDNTKEQGLGRASRVSGKARTNTKSKSDKN